VSNLDINNPYLKSQPDSVGVKNNRLLVDINPVDFGTFAVTTLPWTDNNMASDQVYQMIPYHKATTFRINNSTGKTIGIRRRHKTIVVEDFEDEDTQGWTGSLQLTSNDIEGFYSGVIKSTAHKSLTSQDMLDDSEVEVKFFTPNSQTFTVTINVWDDPSRIGLGTPAAVYIGTDYTLSPNQSYKVIFRLRPTESKADTILEYVDGQRETVSTNVTGQFGTSNMQNSLVSIECTNNLIVDSIVYQQKVNYSVEHILSPASSTYPCYDNISEYEVINLGSDPMNYTDTNVAVTLSGFYAV
jgi:hypothetical protein